MRHTILGASAAPVVRYVSLIGVLCLMVSLAGAVVPGVRAQGSGDWSAYQDGNARTGFNSAETVITPSTVSSLKPKWTDTSSGSNVSAQPVTTGGMVYWG